MKKRLNVQLSVAEKIMLVVVMGWSVAIVGVMIYGQRPDWGLLMLVPYGFLTLMYCVSDSSVED